MVKILYGVCGEGLGHASRTRILINHLKKNHEIRIVAGGKAFTFLSKEFKNVEEIESPRFIYDENTVRLFKSILKMAYRTISSTPFSFFKVRKIIKEFKPDLLITDADPISHYAARLSGIKRISIDNPQVMLHRSYKVTYKEFWSWLALIIALKIAALGANKYIIYDFFDEQITNPKVLFLKPLIQEGIQKQKSIDGDHVFVYQTSISHENLFEVLKKINETFIIYGFNREFIDENIIFRSFNEDKFYHDISNAKAVITNGGFTVLSEALFLKKPVFSIPIKNQFEQILNAKFIKKLGVGVYHMHINEHKLKGFLKHLDKYKEKLKLYNPGSQEELLKQIEHEILRVCS
jgi:uncharacterized protein (TIGR00661 family)